MLTCLKSSLHEALEGQHRAAMRVAIVRTKFGYGTALYTPSRDSEECGGELRGSSNDLNNNKNRPTARQYLAAAGP